MKKVITYIADDGRVFDNEVDCYNYEREQERKKTRAVQDSMLALDLAIWKHFHPEDEIEEEDNTESYVAYIWLKADIVSILCDDAFDMQQAKDTIADMVKKAEYSDVIQQKYVQFDAIMEEVKIRRDFKEAFDTMPVHEIASICSYSFGKNDLRRLAQLHKSNKCRKKIEDLLTAANFHYECGKFHNKEYKEFIA